MASTSKQKRDVLRLSRRPGGRRSQRPARNPVGDLLLPVAGGDGVGHLAVPLPPFRTRPRGEHPEVNRPDLQAVGEILAVVVRAVAIVVSVFASWLLFTFVLARLPLVPLPMTHAMKAGLVIAIAFELMPRQELGNHAATTSMLRDVLAFVFSHEELNAFLLHSIRTY